MTFHITHVIKSEDDQHNHCISDEILQHVELSELSSATLTLKKNCSVILIHNINIIIKFYNEM